MDGWIKLHRKFLEWGWIDKPDMVSLFIHLLLSASTEDKLWHGMTVKRGQVITSLKSLSKKTGISIQGIRTCLSNLKLTSEVTNKSTNKFRVITITKYDSYQSHKTTPNKQTNKQTNKQSTSNQQTTNNILRSKEIKNNNTSHAKSKNPITYNPETKLLEGIEMPDIKLWERSYKLVNIHDALHDMCAKIPGNYEDTKDWKRFITNWLSSEQKRARKRSET